MASRCVGFGVAVGVCASAELLRISKAAPQVTILVKPLRLKVSIRPKTPLKFNSQFCRRCYRVAGKQTPPNQGCLRHINYTCFKKINSSLGFRKLARRWQNSVDYPWLPQFTVVFWICQPLPVNFSANRSKAASNGVESLAQHYGLEKFSPKPTRF